MSIYSNLVEESVNPIIIAAWVHHAFTQIHPFQDGNGRIARLLASLILIKNGLLPFTVKRNDKVKYIEGLEAADNNLPQKLVSFFALEQKKSIELALNFKTEKKANSLAELALLFNEKIEISTTKSKQIRTDLLNKNRDQIFEVIYEFIGEIKDELHGMISKEIAGIGLYSCKPNDPNYYFYTNSIIEYANQFDYYFNRNLPKGWFRIYFNLPDKRKYNLVLSIHHYGYDDDVVAIGSFLDYSEQINTKKLDETRSTIPINIEPFTISLENIDNRKFDNMKDYIRDVVRVGLTIIIQQIN